MKWRRKRESMKEGRMEEEDRRREGDGMEEEARNRDINWRRRALP